MDLAENPKSWQFIDRSGRKWKKNNYFDMLNRTVTANVARDTYHDALADENRDLVQIIGGTSADSNEACIKFDGKIVSMTGATSGFPTLGEYISEGGFHPNCVHSTAYISKTFGPHQKLIEEQTGEAVVDEPQVVEFVPAKTVKEAEAFAQKDFGIDANYTGLSVDNANGINSSMVALKSKMGKSFPDVKSIKPSDISVPARALGNVIEYQPDLIQGVVSSAQTAAQTQARIKKLRTRLKTADITDDARKSTERRLRRAVAESKEIRFGVPESPAEVIVHELGHVSSPDFSSAGRGYKDYVKLTKDRDAHGLSLSQYASSDPSEFFAEAFVSRFKGENINVGDFTSEILDGLGL